MSRPALSVPRMFTESGAARVLVMLAKFSSNGASTGARMASTAMVSRITSEAMPMGFFKRRRITVERTTVPLWPVLGRKAGDCSGYCC